MEAWPAGVRKKETRGWFCILERSQAASWPSHVPTYPFPCGRVFSFLPSYNPRWHSNSRCTGSHGHQRVTAAESRWIEVWTEVGACCLYRECV